MYVVYVYIYLGMVVYSMIFWSRVSSILSTLRSVCVCVCMLCMYIYISRYGSIQHDILVEGEQHTIYSPKILEKPKNQTLVEGMDAYFSCR